MSLNTIASAILRNVQIDEDSSAPSVLALADAKAYANERAKNVWSRRLWREYIILGTFTVPASTKRIALTDIVVDSGFTAGSGFDDLFEEVVAIREGSNPLLPQDPGAINAVKPDDWASTTSPVKFVNRGASGLFLLGEYSAATALSFFGKAKFQTITDAETWILRNEQCLIEGGTGDFIRDHDRDDNRAKIRYDAYEAEIMKMIDAQEVQGANIKRVIPINPWTKNLPSRRNFTVTGISTIR